MNCDEAATLWSPARDGELERKRQDELEAHLATCAACRQRVADDDRLDQDIAAALKRPGDPQADVVRWNRALAAAIAGAPVEARRQPWWTALARRPTSSQLRWFALAASLALLAFFSMAGLGLRHSFHQPAAPAAQGPAGNLPDGGR